MTTNVMPATRCTECGGRLIQVDGHTSHPSCDPHDVNAAAIRAAYAAKDAGQRATIITAPDDHSAAVEIIRQAACRMRVFSSNDLRSVPGWEKLHPPVRGAAFTTAGRRGWIRKIGAEPSSSKATHSHDIKKYESTIYLGGWGA